MNRPSWIAGIALGVALSAQAADPSRPSDEVLLREAGAALAGGRPQRALALYETVAHRGESLEAELGLIRASLRLGAFRQAMSFANLTAGEHRDSAEALSLQAWLLDRVGQTDIALRQLHRLQLDQPMAFAPVLAEADILIDRGAASQAAGLLDRWQKSHPGLRPEGLGRIQARLAPAASLGGNGVIIDGGRRVLTTRAAVLGKGQRFRVQNARGEQREGQLAGGAEQDLQILVLSQPFPAAWSIPFERFAAPEAVHLSFALGFAVPVLNAGDLPAISTGVVLRPDTGLASTLQITSSLASGHVGSPVFDPRGRLIGISLSPAAPTAAGKSLVPQLGKGQFALRVDGLRPRSQMTIAPPQGPLAPPEEVYEGLVPSVVAITALP